MPKNNVAIAFNTKADTADRIISIERILPTLHQPGKYDLFWFDGSDQPPTVLMQHAKHSYVNVVGAGGDYAVVFALTTILAHPNLYTHIGICEDDVLLEPDWFERCMALFRSDAVDDFNLPVGAVSARAYENRCFIQRDGYAVMHNLGWGHLILTREAAQLTLDNYRTGWTTENRKTFAALSGRDIGPFWAWKGLEQWFCSDWGNDAMLAARGLAALALTPSACDMINQNPPLEAQNLRLVQREVSMLRDDRVFKTYAERLRDISEGFSDLDTRPKYMRLDNGNIIYFAHQLKSINAQWSGGWNLEWSFGFGPFAYKADKQAELRLRCLGPVTILIGGGKIGGKCIIRDLQSGYEVEPQFTPHQKPTDQLFMEILVPASASYRTITVTDITPGVIVYGIKTADAQLVYDWTFDATHLPEAGREIDVDAREPQENTNKIQSDQHDDQDHQDSNGGGERFRQRNESQELMNCPQNYAGNYAEKD